MLNSDQRQDLEGRLLCERERALRSLQRFQEDAKFSRDAADASTSSYSLHMADQGTDAMQREKASLFATKEVRYLRRTEDALRRLYQDPERFGFCHHCGAEVPFERLYALPHARYCLSCKLREESLA